MVHQLVRLPAVVNAWTGTAVQTVKSQMLVLPEEMDNHAKTQGLSLEQEMTVRVLVPKAMSGIIVRQPHLVQKVITIKIAKTVVWQMASLVLANVSAHLGTKAITVKHQVLVR